PLCLVVAISDLRCRIRPISKFSPSAKYVSVSHEMVSITDQIAVVTGAGRGIGRAIAIELGKLGARVVLAARSRTELEETARVIGSNASVIPANVRKKDELQSLFEQVATVLGPVDILVNAAGVGI